MYYEIIFDIFELVREIFFDGVLGGVFNLVVVVVEIGDVVVGEFGDFFGGIINIVINI